MSQSFSKRLTQKLIDWLVAFSLVFLLLWFFMTQPVLVRKSNLVESNINIDSLKNHVQLLTNGYAPRTLSNDTLNDTADYIYNEFFTVGIPEYQIVKTISKEYRNVFLQLGPDTEELYVIGAHYDAEDDSIDTEGNASGIATLIELAKNLAQKNDQLKIGVILIAYPLSLNQSDNIVNTGSYLHAESLKKQNKKVKLMISLDGVGFSNEKEEASKKPTGLLTLFNLPKENHIDFVGRRFKDFKSIRNLKKEFNSGSSLSLNSKNQNLLWNLDKTQSSDHVNYWQQGYPAVLISDLIANDKATYGLSKVELKDRLDYEKLAMLVNGLFQVVIQTDRENDENTQLVQRSRNKKSKSSFN